MVDEMESGAAGTAEADAEGTEASALEDATRKVREQRDEKVPHTVTEEKPLPGARRQICVKVERAEWDQRIGKLFKEIQQNAAVEGFRKGKAPVALLKRRFQKDAETDVLEKMVPLIIREYEQSKEATLYGTPLVTDYKVEDDSVAVTLEVEVKPEIEPKDYTGVEVESQEYKMSPEIIDTRVEDLRQQNATYEEVDRELREKDALVIDLKAVDSKGKTVENVSNQLIDNTERLPEAVAQELLGKKAGYTTEVKAPVGKKGDIWRYTVTLKTVKELKVPTLDDEFAKDIGYDDIAGMRKTLEEQYQKQLKSVNEDEAFDALMLKLVEAHEFEVPAALKQATERSMLQTDLDFMRTTGSMPRRLHGKSRDQYYDELDKSAEQRVKAYLLIDAIGKKENIQAGEEDINAALQERAEQEGRKPAAIRAALERRREWEQFLDQARFNKIRSFLLSKAKIKYVEPKKEEEKPAEAEAKGDDEGAETASEKPAEAKKPRAKKAKSEEA